MVFPSVRDRDSQPYDGRYGGAGVDTETDDDETLAGPQGEFQRLVGRRRIGGRGGTLSQSAEDRGGPAPFVGHMWAAEVTPGVDAIAVVVRNGSGGSTLRTIASAASGIIRRDLLAYFDGSAWRVKWLVTNLP